MRSGTGDARGKSIKDCACSGDRFEARGDFGVVVEQTRTTAAGANHKRRSSGVGRLIANGTASSDVSRTCNTVECLLLDLRGKDPTAAFHDAWYGSALANSRGNGQWKEDPKKRDLHVVWTDVASLLREGGG